MNKFIALLLIVTGCSFGHTAMAEPWHIHNEVDQEFSVVWQAAGCSEEKTCGHAGSTHLYICKKQKVGPNKELTYKWDGSGKSDKKVFVCTDNGAEVRNSTDSETYICPASGEAPDNNWTLSSSPCS
jgi:hypothetical protein